MLGYLFPTQTLALLSVASEKVGDCRDIFTGILLQQAFTTCSRCLARGTAY